jgi:hypothetical protein
MTQHHLAALRPHGFTRPLRPLFMRCLAGLLLTIIIAGGDTPIVSANAHHNTEPPVTHGHVKTETVAHGEGKKEPAPEAFVVLDLFSEALEASVAGVGVKVTELKPKVEHIHELYQNGEKHKAFVKTLGVSTEVVLLGFFIETFGVGELFISALSFSGNWLLQLAQSAGGIMASSKVALIVGEKVEEAAEEKYEHVMHAEALAKPGGSHHAGPAAHKE